jgi:hypothetical protein
MYASPMMEQSLVDDARIAYEYGLTSTPISNDFSFIDQRTISPIQQPRPTPTHQSWFGVPNQQHPFINRTFSMPQQQQMNEMATAMIMQQQQNWARQQMFPMQQQQPPQQFEQVEN